MRGWSPAACATCARARSSTSPVRRSRSASTQPRATSSSTSDQEDSMPFPAHLNDAAIEELGRELDAMRDEVMDSRGDRDRRYILGLIRLQRTLALGGRVAILASIALLPRWQHVLAGWAPFIAVIAL